MLESLQHHPQLTTFQCCRFLPTSGSQRPEFRNQWRPNYSPALMPPHLGAAKRIDMILQQVPSAFVARQTSFQTIRRDACNESGFAN